MKNISSLALALGMLSFSVAVASPDAARPVPIIAQFDQVTVPVGSLSFEEDATTLKPMLSSFRVDYRAFMTSSAGDRYALVTFVHDNQSASSVDTRDVVGILADGTRLYPTRIEGERRIQERGTVLLHFGKQTFPIVELVTRN